MRWKLFFDKQRRKKGPQDTQSDYYGFKSPNYPPVQYELQPFEKDMLSILKNLKTRVNRNKNTINVSNDIRKMSVKNEVIVETDKTGN